MTSFHVKVMEYKKQLAKGAVKEAYRGLLEYMQALRTTFQNEFPDYAVAGNVYFGYMDMTYFALFPPALKARKLKIAVVFLHETCTFELWLSAANKQVQGKFWQAIKQSGWRNYRLVPSVQGADSIIEHVAAAEPNFDDLPALTGKIERETKRFIDDVERFLTERRI
ncbi:MAG TPA: hypothetical protein PK961_07175 [bacterium]|nr:hypothetical protein [bacterium]